MAIDTDTLALYIFIYSLSTDFLTLEFPFKYPTNPSYIFRIAAHENLYKYYYYYDSDVHFLHGSDTVA